MTPNLYQLKSSSTHKALPLTYQIALGSHALPGTVSSATGLASLADSSKAASLAVWTKKGFLGSECQMLAFKAGGWRKRLLGALENLLGKDWHQSSTSPGRGAAELIQMSSRKARKQGRFCSGVCGPRFPFVTKVLLRPRARKRMDSPTAPPSKPAASQLPRAETGFCHVGRTGLNLLTSGDPLTSVSQSAGITGDSPTLASQSAGITGMSHHALLNMHF
ncbi:hypothetical protein AAY473_033070 [Plecturocebus cupreus]